MELNRPEKEAWLKRGWVLIVFLAAFFAAPFILTEFYLTILCEALVMSLLAFSFNLLFGYMMLRSQNVIPSSVFHLFVNWTAIFWHLP